MLLLRCISVHCVAGSTSFTPFFFYNIPPHSHCDKSREQGCTVLHIHSVHILPNIRPHTCCSGTLQSTFKCRCLPQNVVGRGAYFISILCNLFINLYNLNQDMTTTLKILLFCSGIVHCTL